jgi:hypothetical protein
MTEINGFPHCRCKKTKEANRTEVHYHLSKRRQEQKKRAVKKELQRRAMKRKKRSLNVLQQGTLI